jgi:hypothetical protein
MVVQMLKATMDLVQLMLVEVVVEAVKVKQEVVENLEQAQPLLQTTVLCAQVEVEVDLPVVAMLEVEVELEVETQVEEVEVEVEEIPPQVEVEELVAQSA